MIPKEQRDPLTEEIIGCCFKVHTALGPGFNEKNYHQALIIAFKKAALRYETEKEFSIVFNNHKVGRCRLDLIVENQIVVEIKALTGQLPYLFHKQVLSYLKAAGLKTGLLINFGKKSCQVKRFAN